MKSRELCVVGGLGALAAGVYLYHRRQGSSTSTDRETFLRDGFVIKRQVLSSEEIEIMRETLEKSDFLETFEMAVESNDKGKPGRQTIWNEAGIGTLGALTRSERIAGVAENILGGDGLLHYFNKRLLKKPNDPGRWQWHQDYGSYWYYDHFLTPDMLTVWVAIDPANKENGGLRVIPKSHTAGRIDCKVRGNQRVCDPVRVDALIQKHGVMEVDLKAGDAIFFHGNTLHSSEGNLSERRRMAFAAHFSSATNPMFAPERNGDLKICPKPMKPQPHSAISEMGVVVDSAESLGLQDPARGAELTSKRDQS